MSNIPDHLRYSKDHEWARQEGDLFVVGITDHAQSELGDVVYVELPEPGTQVTEGQPFGTVESTKAVSELFSPLTGEVVEVNSALEDTPEVVNEDPYGAGWMVHIAIAEPGQYEAMLDASGYQALIDSKD